MDSTVLEMIFGTEYGGEFKMRLIDPRTDLLPTEVEEAMNAIIGLNIIAGKDGLITVAKGAQVVTRTVNEFDFE